MKKENIFKNTETATAIANAILANSTFCEMYSLSDANMNTALTNNNRVTTIVESIELSKQIVESMKLQSDFMSAVSRITIWLDSNAIVVFVGAVFTVHSTLADIEKDKKDRLNELFNESLDKKYNERKLKGKIITNLTETRHSFDSIEKATEFIDILMSAITARKTALTETDSKTETAKETETAQKDSKKDSKKEKSQRQRKTDSKKKDSKKDFSDISADELAQLTKEIVESETIAK